MNKKQAIIILTLLALIVCAGVYAAKINGDNLYVNGDDTTGEKASSINTDKSTATLFEEARLTRTKANNEATATLQAIIDDKNSPVDKVTEAKAKRATLALESKCCTDIEAQLKLKGFEDAVCNINNNTVELMVKSKNIQLTDNQKKDIESVVLSVSKIKNIKLDVKQ